MFYYEAQVYEPDKDSNMFPEMREYDTNEHMILAALSSFVSSLSPPSTILEDTERCGVSRNVVLNIVYT